MIDERRHFDRLTESVQWSFDQQKVDRKVHQMLTRFLAGEFYPTKKGEIGPATPINLLSMASRAMCRHMISKAPKVLVNTQVSQWKSWSENQELSVNRRIKRSNAAQVLREAVGQSMTSFASLFLAPQYVGTPEGMVLDLAIESIDRADFVYDIDSTTLEKPDFCGHKFREKIVDIRENPVYDPEAASKVDDSGQERDADGDRTDMRNQTSHRSLYDYAEIWCMYDRPRRKLFYYPRYQPDLLLAEVDWLGPQHGPYLHLYFEKLNNHAVPIAPLMHLLNKHRAFNELDNKAARQQRVAKGLLKYTNASKDEAERILNAADLQSVLQENGMVGWTHIGGTSPDTVSMAEKQKNDFSYGSGGIVDQFVAQADTLGQERLLRGASNEMLEDMSGWTYQFVRQFAEDMFWFDVRDPNPTPQSFRKKAAGDITYEVLWTKEHRRFVQDMEWDVDVEPYSYVERSPSSRLADVLGALQIVMGMGDQAAAQGITIDVEAVVRTIAKYKNLPELYDVLILNQDPERLAQLMGPRGATDPMATMGKPNGKYTRESESDGSGEMMELLRGMGRGQQQQQMMVA